VGSLEKRLFTHREYRLAEFMWMRMFAIVVLVGVFSGCAKNDGIRVGGPGLGPVTPGPSAPMLPPSNPAPSYPYPAYGGGNFQPYFPMNYGPRFYPWAPIYNFYQQYVFLQPVFVVLWSGWQNFALVNQIPVYDFTQFWYNYCPQTMSPVLYQYFSNTFYPWMTPTTVFAPSYSPQVFWQNYSGIPYTFSCTSPGCY